MYKTDENLRSYHRTGNHINVPPPPPPVLWGSFRLFRLYCFALAVLRSPNKPPPPFHMAAMRYASLLCTPTHRQQPQQQYRRRKKKHKNGKSYKIFTVYLFGNILLIVAKWNQKKKTSLLQVYIWNRIAIVCACAARVHSSGFCVCANTQDRRVIPFTVSSAILLRRILLPTHGSHRHRRVFSCSAFCARLCHEHCAPIAHWQRARY